MTIAAGFRFNGGLLLCADTEQTVGEFKLPGSKIISIDLMPSATLSFAISGSVPYATMCVEEIIDELRITKLNFSSIEDVIKRKIADIYTRLLYSHPRANYADSPFFDLIIGVYAQEEVKLMASAEAAVVTDLLYECAGRGLTLAKYLIKPLYKPDMSREQIELLALRTLSQVKRYVTGCGGQSEFVILKKSGQASKIDLSTSRDDETILGFDDLLPSVFFGLGDLNKTNEQVAEEISKLAKRVFSWREALRQTEDFLKKVKDTAKLNLS